MDEEPNNMQEPPMLYAQAPTIAHAQPPIVPFAQALSVEQRQFTTSTGMPRQVSVASTTAHTTPESVAGSMAKERGALKAAKTTYMLNKKNLVQLTTLLYFIFPLSFCRTFATHTHPPSLKLPRVQPLPQPLNFCASVILGASLG
jgi:hypothetical protein